MRGWTMIVAAARDSAHSCCWSPAMPETCCQCVCASMFAIATSQLGAPRMSRQPHRRTSVTLHTSTHSHPLSGNPKYSTCILVVDRGYIASPCLCCSAMRVFCLLLLYVCGDRINQSLQIHVAHIRLSCLKYTKSDMPTKNERLETNHADQRSVCEWHWKVERFVWGSAYGLGEECILVNRRRLPCLKKHARLVMHLIGMVTRDGTKESLIGVVII